MSDFILKEPIDFEALSAAYSSCKWRWSSGSMRGLKILKHVPSPTEIKETMDSLREDVDSGKTDYCSSGGITVQKVNGELVTSIDGKLMAKYQKPTTP